MDILKLLNLSSKAPGVSLTEGPIKGYPAYKLRLPYGDALVSNSSPIVRAMSGNEGFTAVFVFRQQRRTLGTLLSINSPGRLTPWFQIISNMRTGNLILRYRLSSSGKLHQTSWPLTSHHRKSWPLAGKQYLKIPISLLYAARHLVHVNWISDTIWIIRAVTCNRVLLY